MSLGERERETLLHHLPSLAREIQNGSKSLFRRDCSIVTTIETCVLN